MASFDLSGALRRIRRSADLSQRQLAERLGMSKSTVAAVEAGRQGLDARVLGHAAQLSGLRLALLGPDGVEIAAMAPDAVRDRAGRRFPAHLDTRYGDQAWWHGDSRYSREQPWYTFDRVRYTRDVARNRLGAPEDHQLPRPGDSPAEREGARRAEARRSRREEWQRRLAAGEVSWPPEFECTCPPECEALEEWARPTHTEACPCLCDVD